MGLGLGALRTWPARRWLVAAGAAALTVLVIGLPTDVVPNPVFGRSVGVTGWSWPVLAVTAVLGGLLAASYVRTGRPVDRTARVGGLGGLLAYLAVGCPVCNKVVLLALGSVGAMQWFAPVQPYLAVAGVALLAVALVVRLRGEVACPVPGRSAAVVEEGQHGVSLGSRPPLGG
jgi:hypothetical protein